MNDTTAFNNISSDTEQPGDSNKIILNDAVLIDGQLVIFEENFPVVEKRAIGYSKTLAARAAKKKFDPYAQPIEYAKTYSEVLESSGWTSTKTNFAEKEYKGASVSINQAILSIFVTLGGPTFSAIKASLEKALNVVGNTNDPDIKAAINSSSSKETRFEISPIIKTPEGIKSLTIAMSFQHAHDSGGAWFWQWEWEKVSIKYSATEYQFYLHLYDSVKEDVESKLANSIKSAIKNIEL